MRHFLCLCLSLVAASQPEALSWVAEGPRPDFVINGQSIVVSGKAKQPHFVRSAREYEDFQLSFEYQLAQWAEAAVVLRAPRAGALWRNGIALVLAHDFHGRTNAHTTGALLGTLPSRQAVVGDFGKWHRVVIQLQGSKLKASIDGTSVQDVDLGAHSQLRYRLRKGFITFPDLGHGWQVRDIRIEDRGGRSRFTELFDGQSLHGWKLRNGGQWSVVNGAIRGADGDGILYADSVFGDFEFTALVRTHNYTNSGVFLRGASEGYRGFEVQIYSPPEAVYPTGSIYNLVRSQVTEDFEGRWVPLQIRVEGARCIVLLDGLLVAETEQLPAEARKPGKIGLQIHLPNSAVEFRDLRVRQLTSLNRPEQ
jgi:hypothetical protein